jgi:hypothetical protein
VLESTAVGDKERKRSRKRLLTYRADPQVTNGPGNKRERERERERERDIPS